MTHQKAVCRHFAAKTCKKIRNYGNKIAALPRGHSGRRIVLRHCHQATKLRPRCLIDVTTTVTGNLMKKLLLGTAAMIVFAVPALAADLPARTYTKAPAYTAPEAVYNWTGFDIGGHLGGAFAGNSSFESSDGRFLGGVQGGFNYQFAPNWVAGVEAQYSWLGRNNNGGVSFPAGTLVTGNTDQIGSVTGRFGYTWGPTLLYAKGGYAWRENPNINVSLGGVGGPFTTTGTSQKGYTVG